MRFSENLAFKGIDEEDKEEILYHIKEGNDVVGIYVLCKAKTQNLMELYPLYELYTPVNSRKELKAVGVAKGKQNGMLLAKELIEKYYRKHKNLKGFKRSL